MAPFSAATSTAANWTKGQLYTSRLDSTYCLTPLAFEPAPNENLAPSAAGPSRTLPLLPARCSNQSYCRAARSAGHSNATAVPGPASPMDAHRHCCARPSAAHGRTPPRVPLVSSRPCAAAGPHPAHGPQASCPSRHCCATCSCAARGKEHVALHLAPPAPALPVLTRRRWGGAHSSSPGAAAGPRSHQCPACRRRCHAACESMSHLRHQTPGLRAVHGGQGAC